MTVKSRQLDVVFDTTDFFGLIPTKQWPNNLGHVLVIPKQHIENIYEFPDALSPGLMNATKTIAAALKGVYNCPGISTRQHNEPAGGQDVWHFHTHVFPRYHRDDLYKSDPIDVPSTQRATQAQLIRQWLKSADA